MRPVDPVWPNAPRADSFGPIVLLLVLVLPWIHLAAHAQLGPGLAAAGLRALDFLSGPDERFSDVRAVPPLPKWLQAVALTLHVTDKPLALAAPGALFGVLSAVMLYLLGRVWYSPAVGVLAALLLICNRTLLEQIRIGAPGPVVLFFTLFSLWPFAEHLRRQDDVFSRWTLLGAVALAGLFLTAPHYALSMALLGLGAMLFRGGDEDDPRIVRIRHALFDPTTRAGVVTFLLGLAIATPWLVRAPWTFGPWFPWQQPDHLGPPIGWRNAVTMAPALVVLASWGWLRSLHRLAREGSTSGREALPVLWAALAAAAFVFVDPGAPGLLVLTAPMILLAACIVLDVAHRRVDDRQVLWLAAAVCIFVIWFGGVARRPGETRGDWRPEWRDAAANTVATLATLLVLTLLYRWSRDSDGRRRTLLGGFIIAVVIVACAPGLMSLGSKPRSEDPWRQVQVRLTHLIGAERPDVILFLDGDGRKVRGSHSQGAVLEFLVRTLAPRQEPQFVAGPEEIESRLAGYERPLVIAAQTGPRLPKIYSIAHGTRVMTLAERLDIDLGGDREAERVTVYSPLAAPTP